MGFPETFKIHKSDSQAYKQFGNSVVVDVVKTILKGLVDQNIL
jgi:DNA (cytosine-5)-methyltransferase 1